MEDRVGRFLFLIEFKDFFYNFQKWVGSGTWKIRSWIRNKSFRIRKTSNNKTYLGDSRNPPLMNFFSFSLSHSYWTAEVIILPVEICLLQQISQRGRGGRRRCRRLEKAVVQQAAINAGCGGRFGRWVLLGVEVIRILELVPGQGLAGAEELGAALSTERVQGQVVVAAAAARQLRRSQVLQVGQMLQNKLKNLSVYINYREARLGNALSSNHIRGRERDWVKLNCLEKYEK